MNRCELSHGIPICSKLWHLNHFCVLLTFLFGLVQWYAFLHIYKEMFDLLTIHEIIVPILLLTCLLPTVSDTADEDVTFLYQLTRGMAGRSYGMNVARLANVPADIVMEATVRSHAMEERDLYYRSGQHLSVQGIE